jgi:hypothetical protein
MPNEQWSQFTELTTAPAGDDFSAIVDKDDLTDATTGTTKRISWLNIIKHLFSSRFAADAGSTDTYVATLFPAPVAYETGQHYRFKANTANTGACTVNFNGLGAKTIKKAAGGITTDLADNDIRAGQWVDLVYDGTNMQMQSLLGNTVSSAAPSGSAGGDLAGTYPNPTVKTNLKTTTLTFVIDGGGSTITTGIKGDLGPIDFACAVNAITMLADQSGSIVVDIWKDTYANFPPTDADSITAAAVPAISSAAKSQDATLTGWTTSISAGDIVRFNVDSVTSIQRLTISLKVTLT